MSSENSYLHSIAAAQQTGGNGAELWATDASGQIWNCYQESPGGTWTDWAGPGFSGQNSPAWQVAAADQNTGCLMLFALGLDGGVSAVAQASPSGSWGNWSTDWLASQPTEFAQIAASQQWGDRGVELWSIDLDGNIWTLYQKTPGGAWSSWEGPGFKNQPVPMIRVAAAGQNNGCVILFALDSSGQVWSISQSSPGGNWGGWSGPNLASQPCLFHTLSAVQQKGSRGAEVWATDSDGNIWTLYQLTAGGSWSHWEGPGFKGQGVSMSRTTACDQGDGDVVLLSLQEGAGLWRIYQQSPGGDWGGWTQMSTPPVAETTSWTDIGTDFSLILGGGNQLYGVDNSNNLFMYSGTVGEWTAIGGPVAHQYAATDSVIYAITADQSEVMIQDPETLIWSSIGNTSNFGTTLNSLLTAYGSLHVVAADGIVWMYDDTPGDWMSIGGPFNMVTANDLYCFIIAADGQSVSMAPTGTQDWTTIGGPMTNLLAAENNLYGVDSSNAVYLYGGTPMTWKLIGSGFSQLVAWGVGLFGLTTNKSAVERYEASTNSWVPVAGATNSFCAGWGYVAGLAAGTVSLSLFPSTGVTSQAIDEDVAASQNLTETSDPENEFNWIFRFEVADDILAGYWGLISLKIPGLHTHTIKVNNWSRSAFYSIAFRFQVDELSTISLRGRDNYMNDQLKLKTISAYNMKTGDTYFFDINNYVPNKTFGGEGDWLTVQNPTISSGAPSTGATRIFIWDNRSTSFNFGHAGLMLSDGTYISWWARDNITLQVASVSSVSRAPKKKDDVKWPDPCATTRFDGLNEPRLVISLSNVDEDAVRAWWNDFWKTSHKYNPLGLNCSTVVFQALDAGGALDDMPSDYKMTYRTLPVWTPAALMNMCIDIQASQG